MSAPSYARQNAANCSAWAPALRSWCNRDDPECCSGGTNLSTHYLYDLHNDKAATNFIVGEYEAAMAAAA